MINLQTDIPHARLGVSIEISVRKCSQIKPICRVAASSNTSLQRTVKSVTPFACAKAAPLLPAAELRRYTARMRASIDQR
jgi:hypothetical protein